MKQLSILGKIISIMILPIYLIANVSSGLNKQIATKGDVVLYTITATGENIEFPNIKYLGNNPTVGTSSSTQIRSINGNYTKQKSMQYQFVANNTFMLDEFIVVVDGKKVKTKTDKLIVKDVVSSKEGDDFQLKLLVDKTKVYVGEAIKATLEFKYKANIRVVDLNLKKFQQKSFWIKALNTSPSTYEDGYKIIRQEYIIFPQEEGKLKINKQHISVGTEDKMGNFFSSVKNTNVYSNDLEIDVSPLPKGIDIQGDYTFDVSVDNTTIESNKPINLTINIKGFGNIDDINSFDIKLANEVVYDTKPDIKTYIKDGKYGGEFIQKFSIIANSNFTIPAIIFKYFDIKTKKVKILKSKPFNIKVINSTISNPTIQTASNSKIKTIEKVVIKKEDSYIKYIYAIVGICCGILISWIFMRKRSYRKVDRPIDTQIKKAKNDKDLYEILLPYSGQIELKDTMKNLEDNIYNNAKNKIDKKEIIKKIN